MRVDLAIEPTAQRATGSRVVGLALEPVLRDWTRNVSRPACGSTYLPSRLSYSISIRKSSACFFCLSGKDLDRSSPSGSM